MRRVVPPSRFATSVVSCVKSAAKMDVLIARVVGSGVLSVGLRSAKIVLRRRRRCGRGVLLVGRSCARNVFSNDKCVGSAISLGCKEVLIVVGAVAVAVLPSEDCCYL